MRLPAPVLVVILLGLAIRLGFAGFTGLGIDESYMVAAASRFDWSYFDHPPASWWLELASRWLFGGAAPIVVRLPFVLLSVVSSVLLNGLTARLYGGRAAFWAVAAFSVAPVFSLAFGCWVLPDGPLDAALLAAAYAAVRALGLGPGPGLDDAPPRPRWWLAAGVFAGCAMLSKYSAALVILGAAAAVVSDPVSRRALRRWELWAGGALALALFSPVLAWNAAHHWQSFGFQGGRALGGHAPGLRLHPLAPLRIWGGEALFLLPWLWLPLVCVLVAALWRGPGAGARADWFLAWLGVIPVVLFAVVGIWSGSKILYHWAMPGYLMLFPLAGRWAAGWRWRRTRDIAVRMSGFLLALAAVVIVLEERRGIFPMLDFLAPPARSPLLQAVDWTSVRGGILAAGERGIPVAALRWYDAGKLGYALLGVSPVTVIGPEPHEFGISQPLSRFIGRDVLIVAMPGDVSAIRKRYAPYFDAIEAAPALVVAHRGQVLLVIPMLLGRRLCAVP